MHLLVAVRKETTIGGLSMELWLLHRNTLAVETTVHAVATLVSHLAMGLWRDTERVHSVRVVEEAVGGGVGLHIFPAGSLPSARNEVHLWHLIGVVVNRILESLIVAGVCGNGFAQAAKFVHLPGLGDSRVGAEILLPCLTSEVTHLLVAGSVGAFAA